jgi:WD40 repeat protein
MQRGDLMSGRSWARVALAAAAAATLLGPARGGSAPRQAAARRRQATAPRLVINSGSTGWVQSVKFSPDGRLLAEGSAFHGARLWEVTTWRLVRRIPLRTDRVFAWSPDSRMLLAAHPLPGHEASFPPDSGLDIWDVASGRLIRTFGEEAGYPWQAAWSPDGRSIASAQRGRIELWDAASGRHLQRVGPDNLGASSVAFSPDGRFLSSGSGAVELWSVGTGQLVGRSPKRDVQQVEFTADGRYILSLSRSRDSADSVEAEGGKGGLEAWDVPTLRSVGWDLPAHELGEPYCFAVSPERMPGYGYTGPYRGPVAAVGEIGREPQLTVWDVPFGGFRMRLSAGPLSEILCVAFSPDGKLLASAGREMIVRVWNPRTGAAVATLEAATDGLGPLAVNEDARRLAVGTWTPESHIEGDALSGVVVTQARGLKVWDLADRRGASPGPWNEPGVSLAVVSADAARLAAGNDGSMIHVWDLRSGRLLREIRTHNGPPPERYAPWASAGRIHPVAFGPGRGRLTTFGADERLRVWELASGREISHSGPWAGGVEVGPGARLAAIRTDAGVVIIDVRAGRRLRLLRAAGKAELAGIAWSPDGREVAAVGKDGRIRRWQAATGRARRALVGPAATGWAAVGYGYMARSRKLLLASESGDGVRLWDPDRGTALQTIPGQRLSGSRVISRGRRALLFTAQDDDGIAVWSLARLPARRLCTLYSFTDGGWAVLDTSGHYDVSNSLDMAGMTWVVGDHALPLAQYNRGHYIPGLLARLLRRDSR